ncbi:ATP-dependent helicase [Candidatus Micrarchaeota archaeon]|nr:ATP-dependent helicase [Candidatus Micrarchaeota archaeon]
MSWDSNLNDEQSTAASFNGKHCRLLAGPGTGKTLSLTRRIMYLIEELGVNPSYITALTFTRAAAGELNQRVKYELGDIELFPSISTLHSFALKLILLNPAKTRLPQPIRIADDYEENEIVEEIKSLLNLQKRDVERLFNELSADFSRLKPDDKDWEDNFHNPQFLGAWLQHRDIYGYTLRSELVYQLKGALIEEDFEFIPPIKYLLVDEYQDLNPCDLAVIKHLTDYDRAELFGAGDDDQSIYGFRYANREGIRKLPEEFTPSQKLDLKQCMRCDKNILNFSQFIADIDPDRIPKEVYCRENAGDGEVKILSFRGQRLEADGIASICKYLIDENGVEPSKILILLRYDRNRVFSEVLKESLEQKHISVNIGSNPLAPLESNEGRIFICILQLLVNPEDSLAWRILLKLRDNNIGVETFKKIYRIASENGITFYESIKYIIGNPEVFTSKRNAIEIEITEITNILEEINTDEIMDLSDFIETLAERLINSEEIRNEVILLLSKVIETSDKKLNLKELLKSLNIAFSSLEQDIVEQKVSIMTMHQAKGLTADVVFIAAAEDEIIPGRAVGQEQRGDELRLLYVSITRAKHYLFMTYCNRRTGTQKYTGINTGNPRRRLSRFLSISNISPMPGESYINQL